MSHDPSLLSNRRNEDFCVSKERPLDLTLNITDASLSAGAGFVVAIAGSMMLMPGLGKASQAQKLDVDDAGNVKGMEY